MTIIEATFVFPIMFFIVFFMIMAGNIYFQQARVERIVTETAINAASRCENPMQALVGDSVPDDPNNDGIKPYRYLFGGYVKDICRNIQKESTAKIENFGAMGFAGMEVKNLHLSVDPHIYMIISYVDVKCSYSVGFPIRMIFFDDTFDYDFTVHIRQPISDPAELLRNVSTVEDLIERSKVAQSFFEKLAPVLDKVKKYVNYLN